MRSTSAAALDRRARRARARAGRRTTVVLSALAVGVLATAGAAVPSPLSAAEASTGLGDFALASFTTAAPTAIVTDDATDPISTSAHDALDAATASVEAAAAIEADIESAGLDIGTDDTDVDTTVLAAAATRLTNGLDLPAPLVPSLTDAVTTGVAAVEGEVAELRTALDAAKKRKAEEEAAKKAAAEKAAREAAEKAAAEKAAQEAAAASTSSGSSTATSAPRPAYAAAGTSAAEAQSIAKGMLASYGWGGDQFSCLVSLWNKESGWNVSAYNAGSGAYGIPQALPGSKMGSAGADWQTNAATQISWGLGYIQGRYGTPCGAWGHSQSTGWY